MITQTAKSRVMANRNMEITLLLTEQKHMLGFVVNEADWLTQEPHNSGADSSDHEGQEQQNDIEDADGNLVLMKAFAHRISVGQPEAVRVSIRNSRQLFLFTGRAQTRPPKGVEGQRIREFMASLRNYDKAHMHGPTTITLWRWCMFRDAHDNKKEDFKVTARILKRANNSRNASVVAYMDARGHQAYGEVQFFFTARLPLGLRIQHDVPRPGDSDFNSEEDGTTGTSIYRLALIRKIVVDIECEDRLVRKVDGGGALAVILAGSIKSLIGRLKVQNAEYLTARFTSMIGRM